VPKGGSVLRYYRKRFACQLRTLLVATGAIMAMHRNGASLKAAEWHIAVARDHCKASGGPMPSDAALHLAHASAGER